MRPLLVLDTCGATGYVALIDADAPEPPLAEQTIAPRATQEQILPAIESTLATLPLADLVAVAVVTGPGSFTGVRVGLAVAKGLAEAASLPLVACSALAALACAAQPQVAASTVTAWLDAGRTDLYAGTYTLQHSLPPACLAEQMLPRSAAVDSAQGQVVVAEPALADMVPGTHLITAHDLHRATRALALSLFHAGIFTSPVLVDANYLRVPDAETALRARQAAA